MSQRHHSLGEPTSVRPDPRQLRRVRWLPPLRLTLRLAPPPTSLSPDHLRELARAHARRRAVVGAVSGVAICALAAGSVPGASASAASATRASAELKVGVQLRPEWTGDGWIMVAGNPGPGKDRGTAPGAATTPSIDASDITDLGIPDVALDAYRTAAAGLAVADSGCRIGWTLMAGIGKVESSHGQFGGRQPGIDGSVAPPILGIPLDGRPGVALIRDTDGGRLDFDTVYDRAVGPMQFIPGTWASFPDADGDGNGTVDPHNLYDAALAAGSYLCSGPGDLSTTAGQRSAVFRYNHSESYVDLVLAYATAYQAGVNPTGPEPQPGGPPPSVPTDPVTTPVHPPTSPPPPTTTPPTTTRPTPTPTPTATPTPTPTPTSSPPTTSESPCSAPPTDPTSAPPTTDPICSTSSVPTTSESTTSGSTTSESTTSESTTSESTTSESTTSGSSTSSGSTETSAPETSATETSGSDSSEPTGSSAGSGTPTAT